MRKLLLLLSLFWSGFMFAQPLETPIDFESGTINYTFTDFDGGAATVINNPQANGINTSAKVGQMVKSAGQPWGGSWIAMTNPIDFSMNKVFKMKVYSPRVGARVLLKVEDPNNGAIFVEKEDTSTVANMWEELSFDFSALDTNNIYQKIVLIWDLGVMGDGTANFTFLFDDIQQVQGGGGGPQLAQIDLPVTFEDTTVDYTLTDFGGNTHTLVADPSNPMNTVAEVVKGGAAATWAGTTISTPMGLATAIPFTVSATEMSVKVWSPDAGIPIRLKAEDHTDPTKSVETEANTTMAGAWETLVFDFSNEAPGTAALNLTFTFDMVSIFFNFGTDGATAGSKTYYFDDVQFGAGGGPILSQIDLPVTFEDTTVDYTMTDFGGNTTMLVVDPTDPNNTVAETIKDSTAQLWAGTTISTPSGLATAIPFSGTETHISVRVWSPDAGIPVRLKAEDKTNNTITVETETSTTLAMAWDTLIFDFSNEVSGTPALDLNNTYDLLSIFFNFGTDGPTAGSKTYYFDDVEMFMVVAIDDAEISGLSYYPNPTQDRLVIEADSPMETISVFNLMGQEMLNSSADEMRAELDLSSFARGTYVVKVASGNAVSHFRVVKH